MHLRKTGSLLTAMLLASAPHYAFAQSGAQTSEAAATASNEDDGGLSEITVTARRVSENQQNTPIAITALSGAMLQQLGTLDTIDLSGRAPNVQIIQTGAGAGAASVFIRGIGNNALGFNLANPVGVYVDDVYMPRLQGSLVDLLDLERVEILRGPQGTLYGRDSTVGAIKYVSKNPDLNDAHFTGRAALGDYDRRDVLLGASIPLIPGELAMKVDLSSRSQTGYMIGVDANGVDDGQRGNGIDRQSGRFSLLWTPGDAWRINFVADITNDDSGSTIPTRISSPTGGTCAPAVAACVPRFGSPYKTGINIVPLGYAHSWGNSLRVEYDAGPAVIKSITAYRELDSLDVIDQTRLPGQGVLLRDLKKQNQFSQELQITSNTESRFSWVAGLVYFREKIDHDANLYTTHNVDDTQKADSYAAFANLNYELIDGLHLEVGGRISKEKRWIDRVVFPIGGGTPFLTGTASFSETKGTYKFGIDYAFTPDVMVYASHSTGYRPGSFSSTYASPRVAQVVFGNTGAETAKNNEIGIKSEWFARRLRLNVAAFDTKYNNMQTQSTAVPYNVTATDFSFKGVEVEMEARLTRGLSLFASGGYLDAETLSGSAAGRRPRLTPEFQFSVGGEYRYMLASGTELFANINNVHTSAYTTDPSNVSSASQGAYSLLGANVGAEFDEGKYRVSVGGRNLTDSTYFNGTSLNVSQYYGAPRTVFVEFQVKL
ncbi:TonB-dependent receptor [Sphingobium phenoxybenzoativorans]|uniref:TonB-dependent receptor n=1 Tax=Sphingobium phenoxybenzoativorans TaxID=1592790 RepID=UPI0009F549B3|nr:TonB-dependent receptor [Sphingobium phenoxybenzoativorans]